MWLLPSRRRPENLRRFFAAYKATGGTTPGLVLIDQRDRRENVGAYTAIYDALPIGWQCYWTGGETQGEKIAEVWGRVKDCAWLGLIGDDCVPETPGWDRQLVDGLAEASIVSCDDGWQAPRRLGNCWIMVGEVVRAVGYVFPPGLQHLFVDDVWEEIGRETASWRCLMDVKVAHRHVLKGAAAADETHRLVYGADTSNPNAGLWPQDRAAFESWQANDRMRAIAAAKAVARKFEAPASPAPKSPVIAAREARIKSRKIMLASPIHDRPAWQYAHSMASTCALFERMGIRYERQLVVGSSNLPKARNQLCAWFLGSDCDDLVLIDSDMGWDPNAVLRLLASEEPLIAAVGRRKTEQLSWCLKFIPGSERALVQNTMGAVEVASVGTAFMRITRDALDTIIRERPDLKRQADHTVTGPAADRYYRFFAFGDGDEGEDYEFCRLWRECGGKVWVDPEIPLVHCGDMEYRGRLADTLVAGAPAEQKAAA